MTSVRSGLPLSFGSSRRLLAAALFLLLGACGEVSAAPQFATYGSPGTGSRIGYTSPGRLRGHAGTDYAERWNTQRYQGHAAYTQTFRRSAR